MANEKDLKNQVKKLGDVVKDKNKELEKLKNVAADLEKQKEATGKIEGQLKNLKIQHEGVSKQNQEFRKQVEGFDTGESNESLKKVLSGKEDELFDEKKETLRLKKEVSNLEKKNQSFVEGDESNKSLLDDIKVQKKANEVLQKEKEVLEKKVAKTEGAFPKLPVPNSSVRAIELIAEVQMNKDQKRQAYRIEMKKDPANYLLQITVDANGSHDAVFSQLK